MLKPGIGMQFLKSVQVNDAPVTIFIAISSCMVLRTKFLRVQCFGEAQERLFSSPSRKEWSIELSRPSAALRRRATLICRLFSHVIGHADGDHFWGNMSMLLLVGPACEIAFGSWKLFLFIMVEAAGMALFQMWRKPECSVIGASGI